MVFKDFCILVLGAKVSLALEGLSPKSLATFSHAFKIEPPLTDEAGNTRKSGNNAWKMQQFLNPSHVEATFVQSTKMQRFLITI